MHDVRHTVDGKNVDLGSNGLELCLHLLMELGRVHDHGLEMVRREGGAGHSLLLPSDDNPVVFGDDAEAVRYSFILFRLLFYNGLGFCSVSSLSLS